MKAVPILEQPSEAQQANKKIIMKNQCITRRDPRMVEMSHGREMGVSPA
jgi:hypothetical protein